MKILLPVTLLLMVLFLVSCEQGEEELQDQYVQPQEQKMAIADIHTVVVQEVIQGSAYTYLKVKEEGSVFWIAITKNQIKTGETISFKDPLEMKNFTSKELQRTFETIYFISEISGGSSTSATTPYQKAANKKKVISIEPAQGGITIGELFSNIASYGNKVVRIKGQVVKVNRAIMGQNWIHLQDGTGNSGNNAQPSHMKSKYVTVLSN